MLQFNSKNQSYEATVDGKLIQVSGDDFAEAEAHHVETYIAEGMGKEQAEEKAFHEVSIASMWLA